MSPKIWTVLELLKTSAEYLQSKGIENPRLEAEILLSHALKVNRIGLYLNFDKPVNNRELETFRGLLKRRAGREPLQYITGHKEFWSLDFKTNKHVLIPRPETELLVEEAIAITRRIDNGKHPLLILDIGTGCGAIAISLAKELKNGLIYATDISKEAIMVAKDNANMHEVEKNITFLNGHLFEPVLDKAGFFDLVVSNPPYIPTADFMELAPEIRDFEPRDALNGGEDGLGIISHIVSEAPIYLRSGGWLLFEVGDGQWKRVFSLIEIVGQFGPPSVIKDYSGIERAVKVQKIY
jgi:release factor glutamine methyltransferase